jgi:hypothetical protein
MTATNFTSIPTLDYDLLATPDTRPIFIQQLQHALINVGFLYLEHPPIPVALFEEVVAYPPRFFALPQERKDALRMANSPHFLGYCRLGIERTKGTADQRELFDFATPLDDSSSGVRWAPGAPDYLRLWGPSQVRFPPPRRPVFYLFVCTSGRKRRTCPGSGPRSCGTSLLSRVSAMSLCGLSRRRLGLRRTGSRGFMMRQSACSTAQKYVPTSAGDSAVSAGLILRFYLPDRQVLPETKSRLSKAWARTLTLVS